MSDMVALARKLFPDAEYESGGDKYFSAPGDYSPIIQHLIDDDDALIISERDYSGSTWALGRNGDGWRYLEFGWGSCSGCDALQSCDSFADVADVIESLQRKIKDFDSTSSALEWFKLHDWGGDWSCDDKKKFVAEATQKLERGNG